MIPLTPIAAGIVGGWMIAHIVHIPLIVTVILGVVVVVLAVIDLHVRGHRVR